MCGVAYTSDPDMTRLIEAIKSSYSETAATDNITKIETVIAESNVQFGTVGSRTWVYVRDYGVLWWQGYEIVNRADGYSSYFEINEENGVPEIYRGYELWYLTDVISKDNLTMPLTIDIGDAVNAYNSPAEKSSFKKISLTRDELYPDEYGGYSFYADSRFVNVNFMVPSEWYSDGSGSFEYNDKTVMSHHIVYSDSYDIVTEEFKTDMVSGLEVIISDERYGGENDPWVYYIHTIIADSFYGDPESHHFVVHSSGYYGVFTFNGNEDFSMAAAEAVLESVSISNDKSPAIPEDIGLQETMREPPYEPDFSAEE